MRLNVSDRDSKISRKILPNSVKRSPTGECILDHHAVALGDSYLLGRQQHAFWLRCGVGGLFGKAEGLPNPCYLIEMTVPNGTISVTAPYSTNVLWFAPWFW